MLHLKRGDCSNATFEARGL